MSATSHASHAMPPTSTPTSTSTLLPLLLLSSLLVPIIAPVGMAQATTGLLLAPCASAASWTLTAAGGNTTTITDSSTGLCVAAATLPPLNSDLLVMAPCNATDPKQQWVLEAASVALASNTRYAWVVDEGSSNSNLSPNDPPKPIWLYDVVAAHSYCAAHGNCDFVYSSNNHSFANPASAQCVSVGALPPPPPPPPTPCPPMRTCAPDSPVAAQPFCDHALPLVQRAQALVQQLTLTEKLNQWTVSGMGQPIARLNLKGFRWDSTCIHGPPFRNVTVFPHAINQGATFNRELVWRMSNATAFEMRAYTTLQYNLSHGNVFAGLSCDGGPLANNAHDPRWGRISETYGEDPLVITRLGLELLYAMQAIKPAAPAAPPSDYRLFTSQTTRHYMGYHQSNQMPVPAINITDRSLFSDYLPAYHALMTPNQTWSGDAGGRAEAIMCSYAAFDGVPSCANHRLLQDLLRDTMHSEALVQSDCCNSISSIVSPQHYVETLPEAVAAATNAGTQLCFACGERERSAFQQAIAEQRLSVEQLDAALTRLFLTRMRLGEFDAEPAFPPLPPTVIDSPAHRSLARESAAASVVLVKNANVSLKGAPAGRPLLPLPSPLPVLQVAVVGPFATCESDSQHSDCYLHSYNGQPSYIVDYLQAIQELVQAAGGRVVYEEGCAVQTNSTHGSSIAKAAAAAAAADLVVVVLGLGSSIEAEGRDRYSLGFPPVQQQLLSAVRAAAKAKGAPVVLASVSAGPVAVDPSLADAIAYVGYGGQEAGHGLADIMAGLASPYGRLPVTVYADDYLDKVGGILDYELTSGVGRTYRYLNTSASPPLFYFGGGLSYAVFAYAGLDANVVSPAAGVTALNVSFVVKRVDGGWGPTATAGSRAPAAATSAATAIEVAQVYVRQPRLEGVPVPELQLMGFETVELGPGGSSTLQVVVTQEQLSVVAADGTRQLLSGTYDIWVGGHQPGDTSSAGAVLHTQFRV